MKPWHLPVALFAIGAAAFVLQTRAQGVALDQVRKKLDGLEKRPIVAPIERESTPRHDVLPTHASSAIQAPEPQANPPEIVAPPRPQEHAPTAADLRDCYEAAFTSETADRAWATSAGRLAEDKLRVSLPAGSTMRSIDCRASMCRVETSHVDRAHFAEFVQSSFVDPTSAVWNAPTFSTVIDSPSNGAPLVVVSYVAREGTELPPLN
jgi:hypothetical protein